MTTERKQIKSLDELRQEVVDNEEFNIDYSLGHDLVQIALMSDHHLHDGIFGSTDGNEFYIQGGYLNIRMRKYLDTHLSIAHCHRDISEDKYRTREFTGYRTAVPINREKTTTAGITLFESE